MRYLKKICAIAFALLFILPVIPSIEADAANNVKEQAVVLNSKGDLYSIYVDNVGSKKVTGVKSSNTKVASVYYVCKSKWSSAYYNSKLKKESSNKSSDWTICLNLKKPGKTNVTYKVGNKKYTVKLNVVKYKNPMKSVVISGVQGGKNLASKVNKHYGCNLKAIKNDNVNLSLESKDGWEITNVQMSNWKIQDEYSMYPDMSVTNIDNEYLGKISKTGDTYIYIYLKKKYTNKYKDDYKNYISTTVVYHFGKAKITW